MKRRIIAVIAAAAIASVGLTASGSPAAAYGGGNCFNGAFEDVDTFRTDTGSAGKVDFGDHPHWGGVPQNAAVVCWYSDSNRTASLEGQLFADSTSTIRVQAEITFFSDGAAVWDRSYDLTGSYAASRHILICCIVDADGVLINLKRGTTLVRQLYFTR